MKSIFLILNLLFLIQVNAIDYDKERNHALMLPLEIQEQDHSLKAGRYVYRFPMTKWNECIDDGFTGNFLLVTKKSETHSKCSRGRSISVILKKYITKELPKCIDMGLASLGMPKASSFHLVHEGISGDPRHSPRSLHAENRAIDIRFIKVRSAANKEVSIDYKKSAHRPFYKKLRSCWGKMLHRKSACPYFNGKPGLSGSVGWENANHKNHLHLSVPVCKNGKFDRSFFRR